ncbi:hypothetical protein NGRA_1981 [Nosema granulosis]|uniref:Peptidase C19 ubiquitin carboxyl-terminal hydrolase domain-containing protein n=1 Tax=Nosema granulosis TaxID=83296 RepID=A0A9P6KYM7_9MICR|nr:hypothetical protein NGRA_1981 [Nosema granulosis]
MKTKVAMGLGLILISTVVLGFIYKDKIMSWFLSDKDGDIEEESSEREMSEEEKRIIDFRKKMVALDRLKALELKSKQNIAKNRRKIEEIKKKWEEEQRINTNSNSNDGSNANSNTNSNVNMNGNDKSNNIIKKPNVDKKVVEDLTNEQNQINRQIDLEKQNRKKIREEIEKLVREQNEIYEIIKQENHEKFTPVNARGIKNESLNCYASSIIQCLNNVKIIREYFSKVGDNNNNRVSITFKNILNDLNKNSATPISIALLLDFLTQSKVNGDNQLQRFGMNTILDFYDTLMSCLIIEETKVDYSKKIFFDNNFFNKLGNNKGFLVENCLVNRIDKVTTQKNPLEYAPYVGADCLKGDKLEKTIQKNLSNYYIAGAITNKMLSILIETNTKTKYNFKVPETIKFGNKTYNIRSFCITTNGDNSHFYAMAVKEDRIIEFNDERVIEHDLDFTRGYGRVRMLFYELD